MGDFFSPKPPRVQQAPQGPSASEIRAEEEAKIKDENLKRVREQEEKRATLRRKAAFAEEDGTVGRKQLFGE